VLLGEFDKTEAFRWSEASSWGVLILAPIVWLLWVAVEPGVQHLVNGGRPWAPPEAIVSAMVKVEIVVWWLSHLLSVRGLSRGRKRYLATIQGDTSTGDSGAVAPADVAGLPSSSGADHADDHSAATLAAAGERR
jgi:hypothetical protein